jgi:hypothetical protein
LLSFSGATTAWLLLLGNRHRDRRGDALDMLSKPALNVFDTPQQALRTR